MKTASEYDCGNEDTPQNSMNLMNIVREYPTKYTCSIKFFMTKSQFLQYNLILTMLQPLLLLKNVLDLESVTSLDTPRIWKTGSQTNAKSDCHSVCDRPNAVCNCLRRCYVYMGKRSHTCLEIESKYNFFQIKKKKKETTRSDLFCLLGMVNLT